MGKTMMPVMAQAIANAAGIGPEVMHEDTICPNVAQNIIVISTPSGDRVSRYAAIRSLRIGDQDYEVFAYAAAPENTVKGVIGGIPLSESPEMIRTKIVNIYNGTALEAHRIGNSFSVIVLFKGDKVPPYVKYCGAMIKCRIYRQHKEVCKTCGQLGHRKDVCPRPYVAVCFACGKANPGTEHEQECKPRCKLCGGPHPTGTGNCPNKFKTPYQVRKKEHERKMAARKPAANEGKVRFSRKDELPELPTRKQFPEEKERGRSASRGRSSSREERSASRGRSGSRKGRREGARSSSRDNKVAWSEVAKGRKRSATPARKASKTPAETRMELLESTIRQLQATIEQQQKLIARLSTQQRPEEWRLGSTPRPATLTPAAVAATSATQGEEDASRQKKARKISELEPENGEEETMNEGGEEETASVVSVTAPASQGELNCGARFRKIEKRLNKQDQRIEELSNRVDRLGATTKARIGRLEQEMKEEFARFEERMETRFEEMKDFIVQFLREELRAFSQGNRRSTRSMVNDHGQE